MIVNFVQKLLVFTKLDWTGNFTKAKRTLIPSKSRRVSNKKKENGEIIILFCLFDSWHKQGTKENIIFL